jgi:hypothetical protein
MTAAARSHAVLAALEADGILTVDDADVARLGHCGGCAGSGSIVNPNTGRPEPHLACAGRGLR